MQLIKTMINGFPQGVYAITEKEEVTDVILDIMSKGDESKENTKAALDLHLEKGFYFIPKGSTFFEWNEDIHGKFFNQ